MFLQSLSGEVSLLTTFTVGGGRGGIKEKRQLDRPLTLVKKKEEKREREKEKRMETMTKTKT